MGLKITYYSPAVLYPIDDAHPEEIDYVVISDISGDEIADGDIWEVDGQICSEKEMLDIFYDQYVSKVTDEEEYQKGKEWIIREFHYEEQDFEEHPTILKIDIPYGKNDDYQYALENDFDPIGNDYLPDDFRHLDVSDLEPEEEDYEPDYEEF